MNFSCAKSLFLPLVIFAVALFVRPSLAVGGETTHMTGGENLVGGGATSKECGQSCLYQKSNENITIQALYIEQKLRMVKGLVVDDSVDSRSSALGAMRADGVSCDDETLDSCYKRYERMQLAVLYKMRTGLMENKDSKAQLVTPDADGKGGKKEKAIPEVARYGQGAGQSIQMEIPKLSEMDRASQKVGKPSPMEMQVWIGGYQLKEADFRKMKQADKQVGGGATSVVSFIRKQDGSQEVDQAKLAKAKKDLQEKQWQSDYQKNLKGFQERAQDMAQQKSDPKRKGKPQTLDDKLTDNGEEVSREAFLAVRGSVVEQLNEHTKKRAQDENVQLRPTETRGPAAKKDDKPKKNEEPTLVSPPARENTIDNRSFDFDHDQIQNYIDKTLGN